MFEAGAIIFRIQAAGAQVFKRDMEGADQATKKVAQSSKETAKQTDNLGKSQDSTSKKTRGFTKELSNLSSGSQHTAAQLGTAMVGIGAAIAGVAGLAVNKFAEFDQAMSGTQAATHDTAANMEKLRKAAIKAGADTVYSATEAANAETELAKAGLSTSDVLSGALKGSLALAAAGQLGVADAAEIAATTLKQFNLDGSKTEHVADLLAAGAGKAQGSVEDLAGALEYAGPVAANLGISVDETTGTLALFASQGQIGQRAGTGLRGVLQALVAPTTQAKAVMDKYNVTMFDGNGKFIGMAGAAQQLQSAFGDLTDEERSAALGQIFGNQQITAATVLYKAGAKGVDQWTDSVNDSGYAAETAAIMQDNLRGDIEKLGGSMDTALITTGESANGVLRDMVQVLTSLVDWYGELPGPVKQTALVLGIGTAAVLLMGGTFFLAVPKIAAFRLALRTLATEMPRSIAAGKGVVRFLTGPWGAALLAAGLAVHAFTGYLNSLQASNEDMQNSLKTGSVDDFLKLATQGLDTKWLRDVGGLFDDLDGSLTHSSDVWRNYYKGIGDFDNAAFLDAMSKVGKNLADLADNDLPSAQKAFQALSEQTDGSETQLWRLLSVMPEYKKALVGQATEQGINVTSSDKAANKQKLLALAMGTATDATDENAKSTKTAADAYTDAADEVKDLDSKLQTLIDTVNAANGVGQDAVSANASYQQSLSDVKDTVAKARKGVDGYSTSVNESTAAGAANADMFSNLAIKSQDAAKAQYELDLKTMSATDATAKYVGRLGDGRKALYNQILALTGNAAAAQKLTDKIYKMPSKKEIDIIASTSFAQDAIDGFIRRNNGRSVRVYVDSIGRTTYQVPGTNVRFNADGGVYPSVQHFASGSERHVAQIARAGSMRVWAEPETGGEAYIPLAESKRSQSTAILSNVAGQFGYQIVPAGALDEARSTSPAIPRSITVPIMISNPQTRDLVDDVRSARDIASTMIAGFN